MRMIDASRAIGKVEEIPILADKNQAFNEGCRYMQKRVLRILHTSKTIDAVPVCRCKDCKHYNTSGCADGFGWCECMNLGVVDYHFCSYGERKDGEG